MLEICRQSALEVECLSKRFGGVLAVNAVSLDVADGEIFGLIGANGAGKTTLFNLITGFIPATSGRVKLYGEDVSSCAAYERVRRGLARTFQTPQLFGALTVRENVMSGSYVAQMSRKSRRVRFRTYADDLQARCETLLALFGLTKFSDFAGAALPYGLQRRLEMARAMMTRPRILMLDEPAAGMLPNEVDELNHLIRLIRDEGCTVLVVEHNMRLVMNVCERIGVLEFGKVIATGTPNEVRASPDVIRAYLGEVH